MPSFQEVIDSYALNKENYIKNISLFEKTIIDIPELYRRDQLIDKLSSEKDLSLMSCGEHEFRTKTVVENLMNGLTDEEIDLLKEVNLKISENNSTWRQSIIPKPSIIRHLYQRRLFKENFEKNLQVLEIGPGSGYLGLFLQKLGHTVLSHEIYQPYYMYQYWLYNAFNLVNETCTEKRFTIVQNKINHLPWWHYFKIAMIKNIKIDVVIINHAFRELNKYARAYLLKIIKEKNCKLFMEHLGGGNLISPRHAIKLLKENGLVVKKRGGAVKLGGNFFILERNKKIVKNKANKNFIQKIIFKLVSIFKLKKITEYFYDIFSNLNDEYVFYFNRLRNKKDRNKYSFTDVERIYEENKWNHNSLNENFLNKLK